MSEKVTSAVYQQETLHHIYRGSSETIRQIPKMNRDLAILLGLLFTDGCVSPKRVHSWRIYFAAVSKNLVKIYGDTLQRVFDLPSERIRHDKTADDLYRIIVNSKKIGNFLVNNFGTFRTLRLSNGKLPATRLPIRELSETGCIKPFLQAAFSGDGGVSFYPAYRTGSHGGTKWLIRTVFLSCEHPLLRDQYMQMLSLLGIQARNVPQDGKIKIETKENILKFYQEVGFLAGVSVTGNSKFWRGYDKQQVLKLLVSSYGKPNIIFNLSQFKRGNDRVRTL